MVKNSFTLFETILSITILSIVISGFSYATYYDTNSSKIYQKLNDLENDFNSKNYKNMTIQSQNINIIKNHTHKETILVKKVIYENDDLKLYKYEK